MSLRTQRGRLILPLVFIQKQDIQNLFHEHYLIKACGIILTDLPPSCVHYLCKMCVLNRGLPNLKKARSSVRLNPWKGTMLLGALIHSHTEMK